MEHFDFITSLPDLNHLGALTGTQYFLRAPSKARLEEANEALEWVGFERATHYETPAPVLCIARPDGSSILTVTRLDA